MRRDVFQAIADPTRREIMKVVANKSLAIDNVAGNFDVSRQAISKHIKILMECGLLVIRQQGRERFCEAKPGGLDEVKDWVEQYKSLWTSRLDRMENLLNELQTTGKKKTKRKTPLKSKK